MTEPAAAVRTAYLSVGEPGRKVSRTLDYSDGLQVDVDSEGYATGVELIGDIDPLTAFWRIAAETRLDSR